MPPIKLVNNFNYATLFPFDKIPKKSKIILYGWGRNGHGYYRQIKQSNYCEIVAVVDKNAANYCKSIDVPLLPPEQITAIDDFAFVVVSVLNEDYSQDIKRTLVEAGIEPNKIVFGI